MSPQMKPLPTSRPGTPASLGVAGSNTNTQPSVRSVSGSSSVSAKAGVAPCFHTTRPQFITSHIERCEACRLKYARQAEAATIPYNQHSMRRSGAVPPPRSASRQSVGSTAGTTAAPNSSTASSSGTGGNRPTSSASVGGPVSSSSATAVPTNKVAAAARPSSRASARSTTARTLPATRHHNRSSSAGSALVDSKSATRRAVALTAEEAMLPAEGSTASALFNLPPPVRDDTLLSGSSSSDSAPESPTDSIAARSRAPATTTAAAAARPIARSLTKPNVPPPREASFNEARRASSHSIHAHARRTGNESPIGFIRGSRKSGGAMSLASFSSGANNDGEQAVDLTSALMGSLVDRTRDFDKMKEEYEAKVVRLQDENLRLRRQVAHPPTEPEFQLSTAPAGIGNIFLDPEGSGARMRSLTRTIELDKAALDKFDEFRKSYEDCEPSLRSNRAQFTGERPLSPPPARGWGGGSATNTPMRLADSSTFDHEARLASLTAAEVRRAGEDLMSTPVRRKTQRTIRATSTRRPTKSRMNRPMFGSADSEMSDDAMDHDDDFDDDQDDHRDLRNCLMSASKFGTFLVQYVTRQCLDYNTLCDENKMLMVRHDELEKRTAHLEKLNKRLEESRDDQAAQTYDMSAQREILVDRVDAADRTNRRLGNEIDKLKNDLIASNERGVGLDDQVAKLNASLVKARQRYEQEIANLRRNSNTLQQDKTALAKKNDELRAELKGKLQRAGLKANVDEYLAERKRESAAAAVTLGTEPSASTSEQQDSAVADHEIKRLQETVQFWRKKTDRMNRKLRAEKVASMEAQRVLRVQQEETYRYQQAFGPLPDDVACDGMETLGDFLPSSLAVLQSKPVDSGADSDGMSTGSSEGPDDISQQQLILQTRAGDGDSDSASDSNEAALPGVAKAAHMARVGSQSGGESSNSDDPDARDIRRYEQRLRNRRANMATPRSRRSSFAKANSAASGGRRSRALALSVDVGAVGESLGDILGTGTQWGEPVSARGFGSLRGTPPSLAAELGALDAGAMLFATSSPKRSLGNASPTWRPRTRGSRGLPSPFGDSSGGFGISYGESVSLAEQLATAAMPGAPRAPVAGRPKMVDVATSTDLLPAHKDAEMATALLSSASAVVAVQASLALPSTDVAVGTASTEPDATRAWGTQPLASALSLVEGGTQTQAAALSDSCTQVAAPTADQASRTDPTVGVRSVGAEMIAAAAVASNQTEPLGVDMATGTEISVFAVGHRGVDNVALSMASGTQATAECASAQVATDRLFGTREVFASSDVVYCDQISQAVPEHSDCGMATERMFGSVSQGIEAVALQRDFGMVAGSLPLRDAEVATQGPELVGRGVATVARPTTETSVATLSLETRDSQTAADDAMFSAWLAPLIPVGISTGTVFAALSREGEPVHELHARQVAESARAAADADHERLAALAAEEAALNVKEAALNVKVYADKSVSPQIPTSEQSVQAEPCLVSRYAQAGALSVADAGVDPRAGPVLLSVGVTTACQSTTRWVEPFDPVAKASKHVEAVAATADQATCHGIELASVSAGPVCELKHSAMSAVVSTKDHLVDATIVLQHAVTDSTIECRDSFAAAGQSATASIGVDMAISVTDRAAGSPVETAHMSTSNVVATDSRYTAAGTFSTRGAGTDTLAAVSTAAVGPESACVDRGTGPDLNVVCADVSVGPDQATMSDVNVSTTPEAVGLMARGVGADVAWRTADAHVQAEVPLTSAATSTVAPAATASVFVDALSTLSRDVATAEASVSTSTLATERFDVVADEGEPTAAPMLSAGAERLASPALSHKTAPSLPLPPLPGTAGSSRSPSLPGTLRRLPTALDLSADEQSDSRSMPVKPKRRESNGEDYGYIMVSPRTNVQRVPVSSLSSLHSGSIADTMKSARSIVSRPLGLAVFDRKDAPLDDDVHQGQDIGPDFGDAGDNGYDDDDGGDSDRDHEEAMAMGRGDRRSGDAGVATSSGLEFSMRASMSIGVETADHMDQFVSRQPEPLIVQSIARTMVGTFMHKYTPTRFTHSSGRERRHLRYFWIHPYAKMLNWSKQPPSGGTGLSRNTRDGGSRSAYMRSIRIVHERPSTDDESNGEPEYCIVVSTDHREIKLKATTQADHDLWYMAMSYLQSRRIITSSTYRTMPASGAANHHLSGGYNSDHSMRSRGTTVGSVDSSQRVIMDADRRHRTSERSRSRS
ncbi:hypothetical protein GGI18_001589, partial [Coemansia linderi]